MKASKKYLIPISEEESIALLHKGISIKAAFGTGGLALIWEEGETTPESIREIGLMRGVLNQNLGGAGI